MKLTRNRVNVRTQTNDLLVVSGKWSEEKRSECVVARSDGCRCETHVG